MTRLSNNRFDLFVGSAASHTFTLSKIRSKSITQTVNLTVRNLHATQTLTLVWGVRRGGVEYFYDVQKTLNPGIYYTSPSTIYLADGDELILLCLGSGANTTFTAFYQLLCNND